MGLLALGTIALDNLKTPCGARDGLLGGSASHLSMSARLFTPVSLVSVIGRDFPKKYLTFFEKKGICLSSVTRASEPSFSWRGEYKQDDLNTAITNETILGVLANYRPAISAAQRNIPNVFLANIDPQAQARCLALMKRPKLVGMDTMNLWINTQKHSVTQLMKRVDIFVINDGEARLLTGERNLIKASGILKGMGPKIVVIKKGEHGVFVCGGRFMFAYPAYPVAKVVDPTGAGDTFAGGLMGSLCGAKRINESALRRAVLYATILASFNVEGFGVARTANLSLEDVHRRRKTFCRFISSPEGHGL